jgi:hypothetical protein
VALSASLWGLWWLPLRALAEAGLSGPALNAALYGIAGAALAPWLWRRRDRVAAGGPLLLGAGGLFGGALVAWNLALIQGEVVRVTLLFYLAPVWATLLAVPLLREPVGRLRLISVILGLAGAAVLLGFADGLPLPRALGDWLGLAAGVLFALSVTLVRKGEAISGLEQTMVSFAAAAALAAAARGHAGAGHTGRRCGPCLGGARRARVAPAVHMALAVGRAFSRARPRLAAPAAGGRGRRALGGAARRRAVRPARGRGLPADPRRRRARSRGRAAPRPTRPLGAAVRRAERWRSHIAK